MTMSSFSSLSYDRTKAYSKASSPHSAIQSQVGFTLSQATKAFRESTGIALLYFRPLHQKGVRGQRHAPAAPYPRERHGTHFTGGWVGLRAGLDRCGKSRRTGIRSPDRPARRHTLYRLRYPAHTIWSFLLQMRVSSPFLKVIQQLPTSSSSSSSHFYSSFYLSLNNPLQKAVSTQNVTNSVSLPSAYFMQDIPLLRDSK